MISADFKANIKQEIKKLVAASKKFLQEIPSKLETQCKKGNTFYSIRLVFHPACPLRTGAKGVYFSEKIC